MSGEGGGGDPADAAAATTPDHDGCDDGVGGGKAQRFKDMFSTMASSLHIRRQSGAAAGHNNTRSSSLVSDCSSILDDGDDGDDGDEFAT